MRVLKNDSGGRIHRPHAYAENDADASLSNLFLRLSRNDITHSW